MMHFNGLAAFGEHLLKTAIAEEIAIGAGLGKCAKMVEKEAKEEIGTYQDQVGSFIAWPELAESTKEDRLKHGYSEDDPLLRSGEMRDSISHVLSTDGLEAQVGSNSDIAVYQELGTQHIPPRSFLGGAIVRKTPEIQEILGEAIFAALIGKDVVNRMLIIEG